MNPDRLRKLIDSPSIANATRDVPLAIVKRQTSVTSWNGEQCDSRPFGKLAAPSHVISAQDLRACTIGEGKPVAVVPSGLQMSDVAIRHDAIGSSRREYQSKNCEANPRLRHHDRLFNETPLEWNQQRYCDVMELAQKFPLETHFERIAFRAQHLRNESTAGRPYDIVNGGRVEYFPPTIGEKQHQWQTHPSVGIHPYTR
ncbi:unnamed protein product [Phytophthora fragariaefolia]|uniref:Unnamed protein product n=1 Tax=Phytophthora fragariaefolia TaxID=1490495 RepID=A0A9W7CZR0_9STRA|nr:unnamed protein product [Phytophthora fragariaefolia]